MVEKSPIQVKSNIFILRHFAYMAAEMMKMQCGWIPGTALWEIKHLLARSQWENACHAQEFRIRLKDFPGGKPDGPVNKQWVTLLEIVAAAPHGQAFIQGLFGGLKPYFLRQLQKQMEETDPIADSPAMDILSHAAAQEQNQMKRAAELYAGWSMPDEVKEQAEEWKTYVKRLIEEIENGHFPEGNELRNPRQYEAFRPSPIALRDDRFQTSFRQIAPVGQHLDEDTKKEVHIVMSYFKEMQAVETVATCLYETKGMPWEFYYDTSRHCWDESRHSQIGQRRLEQLGFAITDIKSMNGNYALRQLLDPLYRYAYITMVEEAGSMRTKREWVKDLENRGKTLTARLVEYDLADERNHVNYGHKWIPEIMKRRGDNRTPAQMLEEAAKQRDMAFELIKPDYVE